MQGLSTSEAAARLKARGFNELPVRVIALSRLVLDVLRKPMQLLLLAGSAIYFALGSLGEALLLVALTSVSITIVQEARTERAGIPARSHQPARAGDP